MKLVLESSNLEDYLVEDSNVDFNHLLIREKVKELLQGCEGKVARVKKVFVTRN